jgi:hypothetical protein
MPMRRPALAVPSCPWLDRVVSAKIARYGGALRRRVWHLVKCHGRHVVFCTARPINILF